MLPLCMGSILLGEKAWLPHGFLFASYAFCIISVLLKNFFMIPFYIYYWLIFILLYIFLLFSLDLKIYVFN
jgi:hypothetical protein